MLTVACVYMQGPYPYTPEYVIRLERMVRRNLHRKFWFTCLTDRPEELPTIDTIPIRNLGDTVPRNGRAYWSKVRLFDPAVGLNHGRILFLDLDTLVVSDLALIVDFPAEFALTTDALVEERAHLTTDRYGRRLVRKFNSSVMVWDAGTQTALYRDWTPAVAERLSTDQDWIAEHAPDAEGMPLAWFPRISQVQPPWPADAKVVLVKKPKNHQAAERWPWFEPLWGHA